MNVQYQSMAAKLGTIRQVLVMMIIIIIKFALCFVVLTAVGHATSCQKILVAPQSFTLVWMEAWKYKLYSHTVTKTKFSHTDGLLYVLTHGVWLGMKFFYKILFWLHQYCC